MKPKTNNPIQTFKCWTIAALAVAVTFSSCQKETSNQATDTPNQKSKIQLPLVTNPYSLRNVQKAKTTIVQNQSAARKTSRTLNAELPQYVYFKFSPDELTEENFQALENDSTVKLLDFPFANATIYSEDFALDENKKEQLTDGNNYGVTNIENTEILNLIQENVGLRTQFLDTLALIPEEDTTLQYQAFREAGGTEEQIARLRICLFKRPTGYVRYWDDEFRRLEPVRNMQVWGLVFGIPLWTHTDGNGYYRFPWRFSAGTIMGTHAKNSRVNVKPFNTMGNWYQVIPQLIVNFIVGSVHVKGWVSSCDMRNDVNFDFNDHKQNKYWSQILNAYYFHDQYAAQDGIKNSPQDMVCYAHWADAKDFGSASTPMIHQMLNNTFAGQFLVNFFNGNPVTGTLLRLCKALGPDMTFKVCGGTAPQYYNTRLAQTAFHELGHASMYRQVGAGWHTALAWAELTHTCSGNNPYCDGNYSGGGHVSVAESWAEFIGTNNALRRYPNGIMKSTAFYPNNTFYQMSDLIENEWWFFGGKWIPKGIYHDLMDTKNANETWDNVEGVTIKQMYNAFGSDVGTMCGYQSKFLQNNPQLNSIFVNDIFEKHEVYCK
jgi:hypothetical protein